MTIQEFINYRLLFVAVKNLRQYQESGRTENIQKYLKDIDGVLKSIEEFDKASREGK